MFERLTRIPVPIFPCLILSSMEVSLSPKTFLRLRRPVGARPSAASSSFLRPSSATFSPTSPVRFAEIAASSRFTARRAISDCDLHAFGSAPANGASATALRIFWRSSGESVRNLGFVSSWRFSSPM